MKIHGSIAENLESAILSARRLRGHPVYRDTVNHWNELLKEAQRARQNLGGENNTLLDEMIEKLRQLLAERSGLER